MSQDLRVFTVTPAVDNAPIAGVPLNAPEPDGLPWDTAAAYTYIQTLLKTLNGAPYNSPSGTDPFDQFPDQTNALSGDSSVTPWVPGPDGQTYANYNFAVARVRVNGTPNSSSNANVRVLFRVFAAQTTMRRPDAARSRSRRRSQRARCSGCCTGGWAPTNRCVGRRGERI